jgi:hypothetical protein
MINFNITGGMADCQAKNRLFFAVQAEKGGFWDSIPAKFY